MSLDTLFAVANAAVLPVWLGLAVAPRWRLLTDTVAPFVVPGLLACLYLFALATDPGGAGGFDSIANVRAMFSRDHALLAGWVHYLCFDLFVGSWEVRDARARSVPHILVVPCLFFTLMLGPVGFGTWLVVRAAWARWQPTGAAPGSSPTTVG